MTVRCASSIETTDVNGLAGSTGLSKDVLLAEVVATQEMAIPLRVKFLRQALIVLMVQWMVRAMLLMRTLNY